MNTIAYDDRSFRLDGQRLWLVSGSVHYFRLPPEQWSDRLLKAKRAGLNCISTLVPWNFHEPAEGQWFLEDGHDVVEFLTLAADLGLWVILRPGPFVGGQWDFGGLPAWLNAHSGMACRSSNAAYSHYFDKYLGRLLGALADMQVTRGGNVVAIQAENDYTRTAMPDRQNYLEFIVQLFRRSGFDIPVLTANRLTEPRLGATIETVTGSDDLVRQLKRLREAQHSAPMFVTELHTGGPDVWGRPHPTLDGRTLARRAMEALGSGAQYNLYMFAGGTNFGFGGGRLPGAADAFVATSHDFDAPVAEGGPLKPKYYPLRLVNLLANHMGEYWAEAVMDYPSANLHDQADVLNLAGPSGRWSVVTSNGREGIEQVRLSLADGTLLDVPLEPIGAAAIPAEMELTPELILDHANCTPLGFFDRQLLVFHAPAGWPARVCLNGEELLAEVPAAEEPTVMDAEGIRVALVSSELAQRTWVTDEALLIGPEYVGADETRPTPPKGAGKYVVLPFAGEMQVKNYPKAETAKKPQVRLGKWSKAMDCPEPNEAGLAWQPMKGPGSMGELDLPGGYAWYEVSLDCPRAAKKKLYLPDCEDRAAVFVNGTRVGTWGRGEGAKRTPMAISLRKGSNRVTALVDNLGRGCGDPLVGEAKGLFGQLYDAKELRLRRPKPKALETVSRSGVPRGPAQMLSALEACPAWSVDYTVTLKQVTPVQLSFQDVPHTVGIWCNERFVSLWPAPTEGANFAEVRLGSELRSGKNQVRVVFWGAAVDPEVVDRMVFHQLAENLSQQGKWRWRRLEGPVELPAASESTPRKGTPAWFAAEFKYSPYTEPLFLEIGGPCKGQLYLNGQNLGRIWSIGPQERYYLPEQWLQENNELALFEENGLTPPETKITFSSVGTYPP